MRLATKPLLVAVLALAAGFAPAPAQAQPPDRLVAGWYRQYLNRYPDPAGMRSFMDQIASGTDPRYIQATILASNEYYELHGSDPGRWVQAVYRDVVGRRPDRREFGYWMDRLMRTGEPNETKRRGVAYDFLREREREY
jgi:hypothetical protein